MSRRRLMVPLLVLVAALALAGAPQTAPPQAPYFPPAGSWAAREPAAVGMDGARLDAAVAHAVANENPATKDLAEDILNTFRREAPYNALIGPTQPRTGANGVVIRRGYVVAEWGDTARADMTFSVTKSFLSTVVGLLHDRGQIRNLTDRVAADMPPGVDLFTSGHNASITWEHLLRQTSDWSGTLWDKPDWADRPEGQTEEESRNRRMYEPGTRYKYNDVRVNVLALAALHVAKRPLPEILRESIMAPIGASSTWRWEGYENSWVQIDGRRMQSVTGGGHWGGGMFISAWDLARFGYLFLRQGRWQDRQLVSERWIALARSPGPANDSYGFMNWFLNPEGRSLRAAPASSVTFRGNGQNIVYIDWDNDLVAVVRWIRGGPALNEFIGHVLGAIRP